MPLLFSYGTLRDVRVQLATFGRALDGSDDAIVGYTQSSFHVTDAAFVQESGTADHATVRYTGSDADRVSGRVFEVSEEELRAADAYEPSGYRRIVARLASGNDAWVYAAAPDA